MFLPGQRIKKKHLETNKQLQEQLEKYQRAAVDRIASVLTVELDTLASMLLESDAQEHECWVFELSHQLIDEENSFPFGMPLFE